MNAMQEVRFKAGVTRTVILSALTALVALMPDRAIGEEAAADRIELSILYAGNPGSPRMQDFEAFLQKHFTSVATTNYVEFQAAEAEGHDVVIFDWTSMFIRGEDGRVKEPADIEQPEAPELGPNFDRPAVLIGAAGGGIAKKLPIAINWKCLCLENDAHDVNIGHAIFQGPLPVQLEFHERGKPTDYFLSPGTKAMGEKIKVWTVQENAFPDWDCGLVSSRENFVSTPDAEIISGGINHKGATSVAIGRHGNYLLWGFSSPPSFMTASARNAFVNATCYIDKFDGQKPGPVAEPSATRDAFLEEVYNLRSVSDAYINVLVAQYAQWLREGKIAAEDQEQVGPDVAAFMREISAEDIEKTLGRVPKEVREQFGDDAEQLIRYYDENLEFLRRDGEDGFSVDEDVKTLGVSNRSRELLQKCVRMLEAGEEAERATRILQRYTGESHPDAAAWRAWLSVEGKSLRFDEGSGQFKKQIEMMPRS
jgi:hypothetical protein